MFAGRNLDFCSKKRESRRRNIFFFQSGYTPARYPANERQNGFGPKRAREEGGGRCLMPNIFNHYLRHYKVINGQWTHCRRRFYGIHIWMLNISMYCTYHLYGHMRCKRTTGCSLNIVGFFPKILESLSPLPRQHSAAIYCTKKLPIGVTVHSHCVESFEGLLQRCRRGRGCSEL